jgi:hypothetical protein
MNTKILKASLSMNEQKLKAVSSTLGDSRSSPGKTSIKDVLRNGLLVSIGATMLAAHPAKAQSEITTINFNQTELSLYWQPESSTTPFINVNGSQSYGAFNSSLGTLESVDLSLTVSYNISDTINTTSTYLGSDAIPLLSPIISSPFYTGSLPPGTMYLNGNAVVDGGIGFSYYIIDTSSVGTASGTLHYDLHFNSPSQLSAWLSPGTIYEGLPNSSTLSPYAPYQVIDEGQGSSTSIIDFNETVNGTLTETYSTPEPSTVVLMGLGAAALLALRRKERRI